MEFYQRGPFRPLLFQWGGDVDVYGCAGLPGFGWVEDYPICIRNAFQYFNVIFAANSDFCDALLFLESINPTPVSKTTWGSVKARFR